MNDVTSDATQVTGQSRTWFSSNCNVLMTTATGDKNNSGDGERIRLITSERNNSGAGDFDSDNNSDNGDNSGAGDNSDSDNNSGNGIIQVLGQFRF